VICCAGPGSWSGISFDEGLLGIVNCTRTVVEEWLRCDLSEDGSVVTVASIAAFIGSHVTPWYAAGKAALVGYTHYLAANRPRGIRANAVAPGLIDTPRTASFQGGSSGLQIVARTPLGRVGSAHEVAATLLFLASPAASYVNGAVLVVDGGRLAS
jgi:NAD(P)-dependent dehydrogenase (short-subunit alcohol dehydrogenase family)